MTLARSHRPVRAAALALAALFAIGLAQPAAAQWKWKDKSGRVQYSDLPPPPSIGEADILQRPAGSVSRKPPPFTAQAAAAALAASAASSAASDASKTDSDLEAKRRKAADEEAAKRRAEDEKARVVRAENCQRAKGQLRALEDGLRMSRVNEKGEREILDDKARAEESRRTREAIASECK